MDEQTEQSLREQLQQVNTAITAVLSGGQNYKIGSRSLTRADLGKLKEMQGELQAQLAAAGGGSLLRDTYAAVFDGR